MAKTRVSLVDIARKTGYSVMTVSYALRNHPKIRESTRALIHAAAEELGYVPDPDLVKLMSRIRMSQKIETRSFVAVLDLFEDRKAFTADPYTNAMISACEERLGKLGYQLSRFRIFEPRLSPRRISSILVSRGIEGVILPPFPTELKNFEMDWNAVALICTEERFHEPELNKVIPHHYSNMIRVLTHVWEMGYRRPGLASCKNSLGRDNFAWFGAYYSFLADRMGSSWLPPLPVANDPAEMVRWYNEFKPDVIIVTEDWLIEAFQKESGLRIPEDVGAVSASADFGSLSGIVQGAEVIGSAAADILTAHIIRNERGVPENPKTMMIEGTWIDRGTAGEAAPEEGTTRKRAQKKARRPA
ncbi:MAG: LacI family DNA-binding transcriptional regulator [Opitutales bacterium]|nr:LacI family DNA-binding transcriptional regulator [Opitutales bacterium]